MMANPGHEDSMGMHEMHIKTHTHTHPHPHAYNCIQVHAGTYSFIQLHTVTLHAKYTQVHTGT